MFALILVPQFGEMLGGGKVIEICLAFSTTCEQVLNFSAA
jgi:hypothetical protein